MNRHAVVEAAVEAMRKRAKQLDAEGYHKKAAAVRGLARAAANGLPAVPPPAALTAVPVTATVDAPQMYPDGGSASTNCTMEVCPCGRDVCVHAVRSRGACHDGACGRVAHVPVHVICTLFTHCSLAKRSA